MDIVVTFNDEQGDVAKTKCTFAATDSATKKALAIARVSPQGNDTGSGTTWTRRFIWDTNADLGEVKIDDVEQIADIKAVDEPCDSGGAQLLDGGRNAMCVHQNQERAYRQPQKCLIYE